MKKDESVRVRCSTCGHEHNNPHAANDIKTAPCGHCGGTGKLALVESAAPAVEYPALDE